MNEQEFATKVAERTAKLDLPETDKAPLAELVSLLAHSLTTGDETMLDRAHELVDQLSPEGFQCFMMILGRVYANLIVRAFIKRPEERRTNDGQK